MIDFSILLAPIYKYRRLHFFLIVIAVSLIGIFSVYFFQLNQPAIRSDGVGYYLYLPAIFIEHDISLQKVADIHFDGQIPEWTGAWLYKDTQKYLIKYPIGEALLMSPFFFSAMIISYLTGAPIDGFSFYFQCAGAFSGFFYTLVGLAILWRVLQIYFSQNTILLALSGLFFGTNLFHYATYDSIFSHGYSFFLFSAFIFFIEKIHSES